MKYYIVSDFDGSNECPIDVYSDEGPREAAESFAASRLALPVAGGRVVFVRPDLLRNGEDQTGTYWRVEAVTTYRARPA